MIKRMAAALLWFYIAWVGWNVVAYAAGLSIFLGPIVAATVAAFIAGDPMHRIWSARVSDAGNSKPWEAFVSQG
jgi:hypothetical protein